MFEVVLYILLIITIIFLLVIAAIFYIDILKNKINKKRKMKHDMEDKHE